MGSTVPEPEEPEPPGRIPGEGTRDRGTIQESGDEHRIHTETTATLNGDNHRKPSESDRRRHGYWYPQTLRKLVNLRPEREMKKERRRLRPIETGNELLRVRSLTNLLRQQGTESGPISGA